MPCRSYEDDVKIVYREEADPALIEERDRLRLKVDRLTDLLCKAGRAKRNKTLIPPEVLQWWGRHCKLDALFGEPW